MESDLQEPLAALSELEVLVHSCQEDLAKAVAKARRAIVRSGKSPNKAVSLGDEHPLTPRTPRMIKGSYVQKTHQPSLSGDNSIPLYRSQDEGFHGAQPEAMNSNKSFEYPYTTDAFCNSLDVKSVKSFAVPSISSLKTPEKSPQSPKSLAPSSMETGMPCAPVNSNVGEERRTSKGSMTGHIPSELPMSQHMGREKLDTIIGLVVLLNSLTMVMELECEGQVAGERVGFREELHCHQHVFFLIAEHVFTIVFVLELAWRVYWLRWRYFREVLNIVDAFLAMYSFIYVYVLMVFLQSVNLQLLRLLRLAKLVRAIRIMRTLRLFRGLRLLVHACASFLPSLMWSMALLSLCIMTSGLVIGNLLHEFILDETKDMDQRVWIWMHYGTAYRAIWTMYEMTFAGNWPVSARPVLENVNHGYCVFFLLYVTVIVFAVLRVITAIFVKETLEVASNDAELMVQERMRKKASYVSKLESIFKAMDDSGDGLLSEEEMSEWLMDERVQAYLESLDVDVAEGEALFRLLQNDEGEITYQDFIAGILRCKGAARAIDQLILQSEVERVADSLLNLTTALEDAKIIASSERKKRPQRYAHQMTLFHQCSMQFPDATAGGGILKTASIH